MATLPNPNTLLPADIVTKYGLLIAHHNAQLFAPSPQGDCWFVTDVIVYATKDMCIFWQANPSAPPDHKKVLKFLLRLEEYIKLCTWVMDYNPATKDSFRQYTGPDGLTRKIVIEINDQLCRDYGGASYNGQLWSATGKGNFELVKTTIDKIKPTIHQVYFYGIGRAMYDTSLDDILDWQMQNEGEWGYWTLGFNGAMTVLAPENMGVELEYYGKDTAAFRLDRLTDLATYVNNTSFTFNNTWSSYLLPWNEYQSINDLMSGLLIYLSDTYGGLPFLARLFYNLKQRPTTPNRTDRQLRATNFYQAARQATFDLYDGDVADQLFLYFRNTLRWTFI